jgi:hypothetical protein
VRFPATSLANCRWGDGCRHNLDRSQANQAPFSPRLPGETGLAALISPPGSPPSGGDGCVGVLGFFVAIRLASLVQVGGLWFFADAREHA